MTATTDQHHDMSRMAFWALPRRERLDYYAYVRDHEPVSWNGDGEPGTGFGFWAFARYDDVREISRDAERFSSAQGVVNRDPDMFGELPEGVDPISATLGVQSFLVMDDPDHKRLRGLVQKAFSPHQMGSLVGQIRADAKAVVDDLEPHESGDFVARVAKRLPLITISKILGVEEADRPRMLALVDAMVSFTDPDFVGDRKPLEVMKEAVMGIGGYAFEKASHHRAHPGGEGVLAALVDAEEDGERLTDAEIAQFTLLLAGAGNDTTRNTTSWAMRALTEFPDQRAILLEDLPGRLEVGVEEFLRYATPVTNFMRTCTVDTEIGGQPIKAGEKVMMLYESANRDPSGFETPDRFDVTRSPNRHVAFGGGGPHFCLGAVLARTQLRALFAELLSQFPELQVEEPRELVSPLMGAPAEMAMDTGARAV